MNQQSEHELSTGQIFEPEVLEEEEDELQKALSFAARQKNSDGWRLLTRAHFHVWRDTSLDWRVRFDVSSLLWNKALALFSENLLGRAA